MPMLNGLALYVLLVSSTRNIPWSRLVALAISPNGWEIAGGPWIQEAPLRIISADILAIIINTPQVCLRIRFTNPASKVRPGWGEFATLWTIFSSRSLRKYTCVWGRPLDSCSTASYTGPSYSSRSNPMEISQKMIWVRITRYFSLLRASRLLFQLRMSLAWMELWNRLCRGCWYDLRSQCL